MERPRFTIDTEYTRHSITEMWRVQYRKKFIFFQIVGIVLLFFCSFVILGSLLGFFSIAFSTLLLTALFGLIGALSAFCPHYLMLFLNRRRIERHIGKRHAELYDDALLTTARNGKETRKPWVLLKNLSESREYYFLDFGSFFSILSKEDFSGQDADALHDFLYARKPPKKRHVFPQRQ